MSQEWQTALQAVLSANGLGFWKWDLITNQIDCDSECQRILGYDIGEFTDRDKFWKQLVHPKDLPRANKVLQDYVNNRIPIYKIKLRMLTKSGKWKWILVSGQIYERDRTGKPILLVGTYKDITKELSAKLAKKQQTKRDKLFQELQTQIIAGNPLETILEFAVKQLQNFLQVDRTMIYRSQADGSSSIVFESLTDNLSSCKGDNLPMVIPTNSKGEVFGGEQQVFQKCVDTIQGDQEANTLLHESEHRSYAELVAPILVPVNQTLSLNSHYQQFAIGQVGVASLLQTDYSLGEYPSSHKISDNTISDNTISNNTIPNNTIPNNTIPNQIIPNQTISNHTTSNQIIYNYCWGTIAVQQYDYCREWQDWEIDTLKQLTKLIAIAIRQQETIAQVQRETNARKSLEGKLRSQSQQLQTNLEELSILQKQLLENQKMSNLGQLTIDIVSEINKPANFVRKSLESASQYTQDLIDFLEDYQNNSARVQPFSTSNINFFDFEPIKTDLPNLLWSMGAGSERIKDIVGALQIFTNYDSEKIEKIDIHQGVNSALQLLQYRLKEQPTRAGIQVIKDFGDLPLVEGSRAELTQVFINIITNAIDALEERMKQDYAFIPTIWVNTNFIRSHLSLVENNQPQTSVVKPFKNNKVILKIADNAKGILPHIQRQIFEPLFTTKSASKAKGLGLSICQQIIVNKHQGKIKCNSRFGEGSEFVIEINAKYPNISYARKYANFFKS